MVKLERVSYAYQKDRQYENQYQIVSILETEGPKRFNQLKKLTSRAPRGLSITLEQLKKQRLIEQYIDEKSGKVFYRTAPKSRRYFHDVFTLSYTLSWLEKNNGKLYSEYSGFREDMWYCYLPWGIRDDLALSKEIDAKTNPISKEFVDELQRYIFKRLRSKVREKEIILDSSKKGTIVLGFEIDYSELVNSLNHKDVLRIRENVTEPELDIFERFQTGKETNKDHEKFSAIMELRK